MDQSAIVSEQFKGCVFDILNRPVMNFLLQQHNLEALQLAMRQALRKATCRVYAMQVKISTNCWMSVSGNGVLEHERGLLKQGFIEMLIEDNTSTALGMRFKMLN
jgi:hypothetical protein